MVFPFSKHARARTRINDRISESDRKQLIIHTDSACVGRFDDSIVMIFLSFFGRKIYDDRTHGASTDSE